MRFHIKNILRPGFLLAILLLIAIPKVFPQEIAIDHTKINILYQWVENPIKIVVEGVVCEDILVKTDKGKLDGQGCNYIFKCDHTVRETTITVGILDGHDSLRWIKEFKYRVRPLPDPVAYLGSKQNGIISIGEWKLIIDSKVYNHTPLLVIMESPSWDLSLHPQGIKY